MSDLIVWIPKERREWDLICGLRAKGCVSKWDSKSVQESGVCENCYAILLEAAFPSNVSTSERVFRSPTSLGLWESAEGMR